jgi:hypothetical protein
MDFYYLVLACISLYKKILFILQWVILLKEIFILNCTIMMAFIAKIVIILLTPWFSVSIYIFGFSSSLKIRKSMKGFSEKTLAIHLKEREKKEVQIDNNK